MELDEAADVLKDHFRTTGRGAYKGRIGFSVQVRQQLDTAAVKAHLGKDLPKYQKPVRYETLSLLR